MNNCEIVDNVACGVSFQYCRTHKVEPKDCPGAKREVLFDDTGEARPRTVWTVPLISPPTLKRELKVGDKVRCISYITDLTYWQHDWIYAAGLKVGGIYVVSYVNNLSKDPSLEVDGGGGYGFPQSCFEVVE